MRYLKFLLLLLVSSVSAQNYQYSLDTPKALEPQQIEEESSLVRIIPQDFDWQNIPTDYSDSVWEIRFDFDLAGQTIILPENVTMRFNGGVLENGTVRGDESIIETNTESQLFEELTLEGSFKSEYLKPQWFGAAMDDATDDREDFVETLDQAENIGAKVLVDTNMFLDLEETGKKSIFLADNTWLEGANEAHIRINNLLSPAFYMALTKNITITNVTFLYDQKYDANYGWDDKIHRQNTVVLTEYLEAKHGLEFKSSIAITKSPIAWRSIIYMDAPENVKLENVTFKAKGKTADSFIQWVIKLKEQYKPNQIISNNSGATRIPNNILLKNVTIDGVIMGIQGIVDGFSSDGLVSQRYSDVQDINGNSIGGDGVGGKNWMHPPHLIYLNSDDSGVYHSQNINIYNTTDYGVYVGTKKVRGSFGYCHSLKLVGNINDVRVINYKNYRRDGLWDLENITDGIFEGIYSESFSDIFDPNLKFQAARFLGKLNRCEFKNVIIKDMASISEIYPWDSAIGNHVTMDGLHIYVNELPIIEDGPFALFGSNNTILNSSFYIENHTAPKNYMGILGVDTDTRMNGSNNHYDVEVTGWRKINTKTLGKSMKLIFQDSSNHNPNYARVIDVSNDFITEKVNNVKKDIWKYTEVVKLESGTSQLLNMIIPYQFAVNSISLKVVDTLETGVSVSIGTKQSEVFVNLNSSINESVSKGINLKAETFVRPLYFFADKDMKSKGKIEITIEFMRQS
ncbi:hypothetical protein [Zobellia uliginosa]|uniref:hypothetical protein n=1 Tax=Zobellia uliginosa TaxID=143224 RepID=UPI001C072E79|nr:hypothetical protein [Zobellia uliginosa]MBU2948822.1 hypothetical protein [Zobellia uliginosa]